MKTAVLKTLCLIVSLTAVVSMSACATAPSSAQGKTDIRNDANNAVSQAKAKDPTLANELSNAAGYAVFPSVGKGGVGIGGAYGRGVLYQNNKIVGYCDLTQASIGLQLGGQTYTEVIVFATKDALNRFKSGNFAFSAQASAVALKSGAAANAKYEDGVAVFTMSHAGLMYEASIGGQKFNYQPSS